MTGATLLLAALAWTACTGAAEKADSRGGTAGPAATGGAATAAPAAADSAKPLGTLVSLDTPKGKVQAYLIEPHGASGPVPGVVIVHEWWGLNRQIERLADRLSAEGYAVIVPDLYHGHVTDDPEKAHELLRGLTDESGVTDLRAAAEKLRASPSVGAKPIGVMGFCMGGRLALLTSLSGAPMKACVMFYGTPVTDTAELAKLPCPLLGLFGAEDQGITAETVNAFGDDLKKAGKNAEIKVYDHAGHAFMNEERPGYRPEAAKDAWGRVGVFLAKNLKG